MLCEAASECVRGADVLAFLALVPLAISRGTKAVEKALTARAFEGLARAPEAALPFTLLRDTLVRSEHWGLRVCGVHVTLRVVGRAIGLFITISALLPRIPESAR